MSADILTYVLILPLIAIDKLGILALALVNESGTSRDLIATLDQHREDSIRSDGQELQQ